MEPVGYALRAEYEGTTEIEQDGETVEVPTFQGGLLAVGDGDFDVAKELAAGNGVIVASGNDQRLLDLLDQYPALKREQVPEGRVAISPYKRQNVEGLRHLASLRDVQGAGSASKAAIVAALDEQDRRIAAKDLDGAAHVKVGDVVASDGLDRLKKDQLEALYAQHDRPIPDGAKTNADLIVGLREAGIAANPDDQTEG